MMVAALGGWLALPPLAQGAPTESAAWDLIGGSSSPGAWEVGVQGGWPWFVVRGQAGLASGWTPVVEVETALFRRWHPSAGVAKRLVDQPRWRLTAEALVGWHVQTGVLEQRGPSTLARFRLLGTLGRVAPWLTVGSRHTWLFDRTTTVRQEGTTTEWDARFRWSPQVSTGVVVAVTPRFGFDIGLDWHLTDVQSTALSLPGIHVGLQTGGPR